MPRCSDIMATAMLHESHYTCGEYVNDSLGLSVGWVAHAGSFADCLPVWNETNDICLFFSGEDFTDTSDIERLRVNGHEFDPDNGSYLVHLYEELGIKFLEKLNGCFNGLLMDLRARKIVLFNDRYGLQRIYYHEHSTGFYFSSEAKALLRALPELRELDLTSLAETFSFGCVLGNRTLFRRLPCCQVDRAGRSGKSERHEGNLLQADAMGESGAVERWQLLRQSEGDVFAEYSRSIFAGQDKWPCR